VDICIHSQTLQRDVVLRISGPSGPLLFSHSRNAWCPWNTLWVF